MRIRPTRTKLLALLLAAPLTAASFAGFAQSADQSPVGNWTTIDDKTGRPKSIVEIYQAEDGTLAGRVSEVLQSDRGPNPVCDKCSGDRKDQPVKGMVILWGLRRDGDIWEDGQILDPATGKIYSAKLTPAADGRKLEVRGFVGFSLLGRTQTWIRDYTAPCPERAPRAASPARPGSPGLFRCRSPPIAARVAEPADPPGGVVR